MLFTQLHFWAFFAVTLALYVVLPHRAQNRMLLAASYLFYAAWDWRFLGLMLFSTVVAYLTGLRMGATNDPAARRRFLMISVFLNLGVLAIFKYLGFFVESFTDLLSTVGLLGDPLTLSIILPVGISFYTFQTLSYSIDLYRRDIEPERDFLDFALFVAFFPQLVAGPIERASNLLPNVTTPRRMTWEGVGVGCVLCLLGLIKKIVLADGVAPSVNAIFAAPDPSGGEVLLGTWLFAAQIYGDFAGYTDIARGVAMILGFRLMRNFAQPYFATNPQDFWRRWHISLSSWLRDYLYIPLGGSRGGRLATYRNLMTTMVLGGLWHGAAWNFVLWGGYQGVLLCAHRAIAGPKGAVVPTPRWRPAMLAMRILTAVLFFQVVCYGWLLFRASSLGQIVDFTGRLLTISPGDFTAIGHAVPPLPALAGLGFVLAWDLAAEISGNGRFFARLPAWAQAGLYAVMIHLLAFGAGTASTAFIYFQF